MLSCVPWTPDHLPRYPGQPCMPARPRPTTADPSEGLRLLSLTQTEAQLKQAHAHLLRHGLARHPAVSSALVRLYSSHHRLDLASSLFSSSFSDADADATNAFSWNLMIRAHASHGSPLDSLRLYNLLISRGSPPPDKFTFPFAITACSALVHLPKGMELHAFAIKAGFSVDTYVQNALIHLYFTCGVPDYARKVFDRMPARTVVSWTALIDGLITCGYLDDAKRVFDAAPVRNVVTWTAIIDGFVRNGRPEEAFELFRRMQEDNVMPNAFTIVTLLIACVELGSLQLGRWVHDFARKIDRLDTSVYVGTSLIDMYSKCGSLDDAVKVFGGMPAKTLPTWNSMITSLGVHGRGQEALALFKEMEEAGVKPDAVTLFGVLCACTRAGMVQEGCRLFRHMVEHYGVKPDFEHYKCLVELLGSTDDGAEDVTAALVKELVVEMDGAAVRTLLEACREQRDSVVERAVRRCIAEVGDESVCNPNGSSANKLELDSFEWEVG